MGRARSGGPLGDYPLHHPRDTAEAAVQGRPAAAIGLTNQRETTLLWDRRTGVPVYNAIVWQDRRTAERCRALEQAGHESALAEKTGLRLDPYFSATKLEWILNRVSGARAAAKAGQLAFGTVDCFLIWRLTGGRVHATDVTNASRTALFDIRAGCWDRELCELFDIPLSCLPEVRDSAADFGVAGKDVIGVELPIAGATTYALEGSILSAGATIQWLRDGLGIIARAPEVTALAQSVSDTGGVYVAPAFTGLGAPYWDPDARGAILGLSRASGRAEIARAALDSVAYQTHDLLEAMAADGVAPAMLKVDGGMAQNEFFLQRLADILGRRILRPRLAESTAFGAACLAGLGRGFYGSLSEIARLWQAELQCEPRLDAASRAKDIAGWQAAIRRVQSG